MESNGPPEPKRPRIGPSPSGPPPPTWPTLPPPPTQYPQHGSSYARPDHQANSLEARRLSAQTLEHRPHSDQEPRRPTSGPSPHAYNQLGTQTPVQLSPYGAQENTMKREPAEENHYRPNSTGSAPPDANVAPTYPETRYPPPPLPPPYDPLHPRAQSYQHSPQYAPQVHLPIAEPYGPHGYPNQGLPPRQDSYVQYPQQAATQKRKAQRAAQACDSCRNLKAKCDEGRPVCSSCKERGQECVYRDPPPKQ